MGNEYQIAASSSTENHATPALANATFWISAEQAWQALCDSAATIMDLRSYDDYQEWHPKGARSFSAARMPDLETTFLDRNQSYILLHWPNMKIGEIAGEFTRRGYRHLYALDMNSWRAGPYKMNGWEQANLPVEHEKVFYLDGTTIKLGNYEIFKDSLGSLTRLAHIPKPTVDFLFRYRPRLVEQYGYDEDNAALRSEIEQVESSISAATLAGGKIWFGFSFYESRSRQGYGGIGFYDLASSSIGVLRHPALVNHSVKDLMVTDEMIFIATIDEFEMSREVGNGLVMIDRRTMQVRALVPPGGTVVWHNDGGGIAALYYDKPIPELLSDPRFVFKPVEGWEPIEFGTALKLGLEAYMIQAAEHEK
jgi:rhodanese-related sulfurtransferase